MEEAEILCGVMEISQMHVLNKVQKSVFLKEMLLLYVWVNFEVSPI